MTDPGHPPDTAPDEQPAGPDEQPAGSGAPPVVAVLVTHDPGHWLEQALAALGEQDYPNLSVLVLDAASELDPTGRVAAVLPSAFVRRLPVNAGFGPTANDVLNVVEGASHFVFLHDDAAPEPDAIRLMLEEAYRSNAGVVAPKLVAWDNANRLLAVGMSADKTGNTVAYGRGELDQEQHDAVRDVFVAPGGCQLVRADLFEALGGFDPAMTMFGEDLDLSWRAQLAGARVVVAPSARVRHLEATVGQARPLERAVTATAAGVERVPTDHEPVSRKDVPAQIDALVHRHRLRAMLKAYGRFHLARVFPQALVLAVVETVLGGPGIRAVGGAAAAWRWNLASLADIRRARAEMRPHRLVRDADVRRLQVRGSARLGAVLRGGLAAEERTIGVGAASRQLAGAISRGGVQLTAFVWVTLVVALLAGSRHLITGGIPAIGQFAPFPTDSWETLKTFLTGWHPAGLGSSSPPPFGYFLIGAGSMLLFGADWLLQRILVVGMLPLGIIGMHRLTAPIGSWRTRLVGALVYAAMPLPYDALARGRWSALVAYGVMPWIVGRLLRATGIAPFGAPAEPEEGHRRRRRRRVARPQSDAVDALLRAEAGGFDTLDTEEMRVATAALGGRRGDTRDDALDASQAPPGWVLHPGTFRDQAAAAAILIALAAALAPPLAIAVVLAGVGLVAGCALTGHGRAGLRALLLALAGVGGAAVLHVPWTFELVAPGSPLAGIVGIGPPSSDAAGFGELLRLHVGRMPAEGLTWAVLGTATLALLIGRRWRFEWAARLWGVALVTWVFTWVAGRGWLGISPPDVDVLLVPAAVAIALAAALGLAAFDTDLPGYNFGWRQVASLVAAGAGLVAAIPMLGAAIDGRWRMPARDFEGLVSWMPERVPEGDFRVLWVGAPHALPTDAWRLSEGLAYASSRNGAPDATTLWPGSDGGSTGLLADALAVARRGETTRVGALLAPLGVRYIAVPRAIAPSGQKLRRVEPPAGVLDALRGQVDLRLIETDDDLVVFENAAWRPVRGVGNAPVLEPGSSVLRSKGPVVAGEVHVAESYSSRWRLDVAGTSLTHTKSEGWANGFTAPSAGEGTLRYRIHPLRIAVLLLQLVLWVVAIRAVVGGMRSRRVSLAAKDDQ